MLRFLLCLLISVPALAGGEGEALMALQQRLEPLKSLDARFTQTVTDADGYQLQQMTGSLSVARPGKVRWQSDEPYPQLVVSDAETLWLYDPDLAQVTVRPFDRDVARTPAILFIGAVDQLESAYSVSREGEVFELVPLDDQALFQSLSIRFDGQVPVAMTISDALGQKTLIELRDVAINQPGEDDRFRFDIPPDVDVIHDH